MTEAPARTRTAPHTDLTHPLHRLKGVIFWFITFDVLLFVGLFLSVWFWGGMALDLGLFKLFGVDAAQATKADRSGDLGLYVRAAGMALLAVLLVALVVWRVLGLINKDLSLTNLALVLEKRYPKVLGDRLITAIEMADVDHARRQGFSADMVRHTIAEARERMDQVNVMSVFNWGRLWWKAGLTAAVWVAGVSLALVLHAVYTGGADVARGGKALLDTASIFAERNVMFQPTPWPRRVHVEITEFDDDGHPNEVRIGKGAVTPPTVAARAYKWVVAETWKKNADGTWKKDADNHWDLNPDGWRALTVADLGKDDFGTKGVPVPDGAAATARIDDLERENGWGDDNPTLAALAAAANDLGNTRKLRKLPVPNAVQLRMVGLQTRFRNDPTVTADADGKYVTALVGKEGNLTESVRFTLEAEDFVTSRRTVSLVDPPALVDLFRDEFQPAYLYHASAITGKEDQATLAALSVPPGEDPALYFLRGRTHKVGGMRVSITGDKSVFSVPAGTEVFLSAETDKDLKAVEIIPVGTTTVLPEFARAEAKAVTMDAYRKAVEREDFVPMDIAPGSNPRRLEVARKNAQTKAATVQPVEHDGKKLGVRRFTVKFEGKQAVRGVDKPTEFKLALIDVDNVTAYRTVAITATDDAPPDVQMFVDPVVRRVGGSYMVTPVARVPFLPDSKVTDAYGLSSVRFEFKKERPPSASLSNAWAMGAAAVVANSLSATPTLGQPATALQGHELFDITYGTTIPRKADPNVSERLPGFTVPRFDTEQARLTRATLAQLERDTLPRADPEVVDRLVAAELARQKIDVSGMAPDAASAAREKALREAVLPMLAKARADNPPARDPNALTAVKKVEFRDGVNDSFDLRKYMPELLDTTGSGIQPKYKVELSVVAKDVNVELTKVRKGPDDKPILGPDGKPILDVAPPKTARNLDPIRLEVVSEADLLVEIGKDEEMQVTRVEDASKRANDGQKKLAVELGLLRALAALTPQEKSNQLLSSQVRFTDIGNDLTKCRELVSAMKTEYEKLYREMEVNRCSAPNLRKYTNEPGVTEDNLTGFLDLVKLVLEKGLPNAEKSVEGVRNTLTVAQTPTEAALADANADYTTFIRLMNRLESQVNINRGITAEIIRLKKIIEDQATIAKLLGDELQRIRDEIRRPDLILPRLVTVKVGETVKVKVGVRWKLSSDTVLVVAVDQVPDGGPKMPRQFEVKAKGEEPVTEFEIEITGGSKPGVTNVPMRPGVSKRPVELVIETTK